MASNPKLDTSSSSPDGVPYGSQRSNYSNNSNLDRSGNNRDGHDGRVLVLGAGGGGGAVSSSGSGTGSGIELPPLSQVLLLDALPVGDHKGGRHQELKRAINAALGSAASEDLTLGNLQSKALETLGTEELKRVRASLVEQGKGARDRSRLLTEAINKLDKFRNSLQSRKRSRPDPGSSLPASAERSLSSLGVGERSMASVHTMKGNPNVPSSHVSGSDTGVQKSADKNKRVVPNKRVRTSMADNRPDGRPTSVNLQRPSVLTDRERDVSRPSSSLASPAEEKERAALPPSEGWEKTKMKGRRSGTKPDASIAAMANGTSEGDREHKWSGQQHRMSADNRSRPSEGHGFRSGPVHGITSVHKTESSAQLNGVPSRGANKSETDGAPSAGDRGERVSGLDRERSVSKNGAKPTPREESHPANPTGITKAKAARAPRSSSSAGGPSSHLARTSSFAESRERHAPQAKVQAQVPSGPTNRKRPAPSRSSSPPAQWVGQRPQKMIRVARRVNLMPGAAVAREESSVISEGPLNRDGVGTNVGARSNPGMSSGSGVARRVSAPNAHSQPAQNKPKGGDRVTTSVGLSESDESEDEGEKVKDKSKKQGDWEQKPTAPSSQKMGSLVAPAKKTRVVTKEEGGDGVRRQGRSGRGAVAPRTSVVNPVLEKVEVSANAKQLRSVRVGPEKHERPGRPPTKKDTIDRKPMTRPRRPVGNGTLEISGESDDDREELVNAIRKAVNASGAACSNAFWKQMEPYFAFLTSADMSFLQQQAKDLEEGDPVLQIPACGDQFGKMEVPRTSTPPVSPSVDGGGGKSMCLANGSIENDGFVTKLFHNLKDKHEVGKGGRRGVSGGWFEKILPLSQRLLAALINEGDLDEGRYGDENCQDDSSEYVRDHSPRPGSMSESDRLDGDSDGEIGRQDIERWTVGGRDTYVNEAFLLPNGHSRVGVSQSREDLGGEGDDILANVEADTLCSVVKSEIGIGEEVLSGSGSTGKEDPRGIRSFGSVANMTAWELQYQRMSVDDRILLELQSVGLLPEQVPDLAQREDDEISEELRKVQRELIDQVCANKGRVNNLEKTVLIKKEVEDRDRERFAVDKLVEIACARRMGSRNSSGGKSAAAKGAKAAGLAFAKRVLARVRAYEGGHGCFDATLKDLLFCVAPKETESNTVAAGPPEGAVAAASINGEPAAAVSAVLQPPKASASVSSEGPGGRSVVRWTEIKSEKDILEVRQQSLPVSAERNRVKEDVWPLRAKEREVLLEDVVGVSGMRDVNALGANAMGGTKGKRSERERDGKGHGKESQVRSDSAKGARQGVGNVKAERKTKTKPRQKTGPLLKPVNGLLAKPTAESTKDRPSGQSSVHQFTGLVKSKEEVPAIAPPLASQNAVPDADEVVDLSNIPIPGIEDLGVNDLGGQGPDLGSWLQDFEEDASMHQGECLMGLEVPMDDLADLGLMM